MTKPTRRTLSWCLLLLVFLALRLPAFVRSAPTEDEARWIGVGEQLLQDGPSDLAPLVHAPPLAAHLTSAPLWFLVAPETRAEDAPPEPTSVATSALYDSVTFMNQHPVDAQVVLWLVRLPILLLGLLGMELLRRTGQRFFDDGTGWIAAAAWALHPGLAGHGVLATPDLVATVTGLFLFASFVDYHDVSATHGPRTTGRLVRLGLAAGLALSAQHEMVLLVGMLAGASIVLRFARRRRDEAVRPGAVGRFALSGCVALLTLWALYRFDFRPLDWSELPSPAAGLASVTGLDSAAVHNHFAEVRLPFATYLQTLLLAVVNVLAPTTADAPNWIPSEGALEAGLAAAPLAWLALVAVGLLGWWQLRRDRADLPDLVLLFAITSVVAVVLLRPQARAEQFLPAVPFFALLGAGALRRAVEAAPRITHTGLAALALILLLEVVPHSVDPGAFRHVLAATPQDLPADGLSPTTVSQPWFAHHARDRGQDLWAVLDGTQGLGTEELTCVIGCDVDVLFEESHRRPELRGPMRQLAVHAASVDAEQQEFGTSERRLLAVAEDALSHPALAHLLDVVPMRQIGRVRVYRLPELEEPAPTRGDLPRGAIPENSRTPR